MLNAIQDLSNKVANYCGFDGSEEGLTRRCNDQMIDYATKGAASLSEYFFWRYYDEEEGLFFLEGDVVGFCFEIAPVVGAAIDLGEDFDKFFNRDMPAGIYMQFLLVASHDINPVLDLWDSGRISRDHPVDKITKKRKKLFQRLSKSYDLSDGRVLRDYRVFVNVSTKATAGDDLIKFKKFKKSLKHRFKSRDLFPRELVSNELVKLVREIVDVNFEESRLPYVKLNNSKDLSEQVIPTLGSWRLEEDAFVNEKTKVSNKYFRVSQFPAESCLAAMDKILGGDCLIPGRHIVSYTVVSDVSDSKQRALLGRGERAQKSSTLWINRGNAQKQKDAAEWQELSNEVKLDDSRQKFLTENFSILLSARSDEIEEASRSLQDVYNGWEIASDDSLHLPGILSMLPLQQSLYWNFLKYSRNVGYVLGKQATAKLPIKGEWKGAGSSGVLFTGRNGQPFNLNPFDKSNPNMVVFGETGGGKSFFMNELALTMKAQNTQLFVLDIGRSFKNLCFLSGGEQIMFGRGASLCINPFSGFKPGMCDHLGGLDDFNEVVKCTKQILSIMCGAKTEVEMGELEKSIKYAVQKFNYDLDINDFVDYLRASNNKTLEKFATAMFSYTMDGIYGKYFSGEKSASYRKSFTVFEFEEIKGDNTLLSIVLQSLLMEITSQFLVGDRSKRFMIIVDEAYKLLDSEDSGKTAKFFADLCRVVRKYGGSLVICVQNYTDLKQSNNHKAILKNTAWSIILKTNRKGIEEYRDGPFEDYIPLIESLTLEPGKYSEMLIFAEKLNVVGRLIVDEYSASIYSTTPDDYNYLVKAAERGVDLDTAIQQLEEIKKREAACE